jgi:membrane protein DedA with SNARE-associated domain
MTILASVWSGALWQWIRRLGPFGLVLLGFFDNDPTFGAPPGTIDLSVIALCMANHDLWSLYALMATVGEVLGGYLAYRVSEKGGKQVLEKRVSQKRAEKFYQLFEKHGFITIFAGAAAPPPFPFTAVLMAAGIMQYPRRKFLIALTAGRALRFFAEGLLGRTYGRQMIAFFSSHYQIAMYLLITLAVLGGIGALVYYQYNRARKKRASEVTK